MSCIKMAPNKTVVHCDRILLTMQLLVQVSSGRDRQRPNELFELDGTVLNGGREIETNRFPSNNHRTK